MEEDTGALLPYVLRNLPVRLLQIQEIEVWPGSKHDGSFSQTAVIVTVGSCDAVKLSSILWDVGKIKG